MSVEPIGNQYNYRLQFDDGHNVSNIEGKTETPYGSILELRNHMVSIIDTLSDCVEHVKYAASDIHTMEEWEEDDEEGNSDVQ
jgi:hypothetical protein